MSNDKDMTPLLNTVRLNKRKASILTTGTNFNPVLCEFADEQIQFDDIINTDVSEPLVIEDFESKFLADIRKHVEKSFLEYKNSIEQNNNFYRKHYNLDHFVSKQSEYYNVLKYEIYNMVYNLYLNNKVVIYNNFVKDKTLQAVIPIEFKNDFYFVRNNKRGRYF